MRSDRKALLRRERGEGSGVRTKGYAVRTLLSDCIAVEGRSEYNAECKHLRRELHITTGDEGLTELSALLTRVIDEYTFRSEGLCKRDRMSVDPWYL